jgi:predicted HTH domain antitoxin
MNITLPEPLETTLTPAQAALHLGIGLYTSGEVTLGQAAEVAHLNQTQFLHELGRRKIPMNYGVEDFAQDLITIEKLRAGRK